MKISVIIPTYNERENIEKITNVILNDFRKHKVTGEIIVVDDNSPDKTYDVVNKISKKHKNVKLIHRKKERGKGSAIIAGAKKSKHALVAMIDSDLQYPPKDIYRLARILESRKVDIVVGKRTHENLPLIRKIVSCGFNLFQKIFIRVDVSDVQSGLKVIRKKVFNSLKLKEKGFSFDAELLLKAKKKGFKLIEVPIKFYDRKEGKTKVNVITHSWDVFWRCLYLKLKNIFDSD